MVRILKALAILNLAAVIALGCGSLGTQARSNSPFVIMILGSLGREGTFESCVAAQVDGGANLKAAVEECAGLRGLPDKADPFNPHDFPSGNGSGTTSVNCGNYSADPTRAYPYPSGHTRPPTQAEKELYNLDPTQRMFTEEGLKAKQKRLQEQVKEQRDKVHKTPEWEEHQRTLKEWFDNPTPANDKAVEDAIKKLYDTPQWRTLEELQDEAIDPAPYTPPLLVKVDPEAEDQCNQIAQFLADCNRSGWSSTPCKRFLARKDKCSDPLVTDPAPDAESTCGMPAVDGEDAKDAFMIVCESRTKPEPGSEPCKPVSPEGIGDVRRYVIGGQQKNPPCDDPRALWEGSACSPSFTLVTVGPSVDDLLRDLHLKLGGPVYVIPSKPKPPRPPGPQPETGGTTAD